MQKVGIFVNGDIGRSPRMQNHAIQLSRHYQVYFYGDFQTSPSKQIINNNHIHIIDLKIHCIEHLKSISYYLYAFIKIILQILQIFYYFIFKFRSLSFVLTQNPPSIPSLMALWMASCVRKFQIWIDFHNYGYTILALNIKTKFIIKFAQLYEKFFAKKATRWFCVSDHMREDLITNWNINAITLYDRPIKRPRIQIDSIVFFRKYNLEPRRQNELLLVSSTSWTKDQDFSILLDALQNYERECESKIKIRTFITGKGPQKQKYMKLIKEKRQSWKRIQIMAVWLQADDYPILLSLCDMGVCLHYSSSGLDLPMKVVDMFGAGIPVLAINYKALGELLKEAVNGYIFNSKDDLAELLLRITNDYSCISKLGKGVQKQKQHSWDVEWNMKIKPILRLQ